MAEEICSNWGVMEVNCFVILKQIAEIVELISIVAGLNENPQPSGGSGWCFPPPDPHPRVLIWATGTV